jgi:hypothetical protein
MFDLANVTVGADPELFVGKRNTIISAHTVNLGSKEHPTPTPHGHIQNDGMAVEVNVRPAKSKFEFVANCGLVLADLEKHVKAADPEMYLVCQPTAHFTPEYLKEVPESAKELGCNPDWNAYEMAENPRPEGDVWFRTTGGHLHIGFGSGFNCNSLEHIGKCAEIAKQLDYTVGLYCLDFDRDRTRAQLYGKAGSFRPKHYGVEYRTLSPMWLLEARHTSMVFTGCIKALRMLNEGRVLDEEFEGLARSVIDSGEYKWREIFPEMEKALA